MTDKKLTIYDISEGYDFEEFEQLGTKAKHWVIDANDEKFLFKKGRANTGENWAEVVACEIASRLSLPHAEYHLAVERGEAGVLTNTFVPPDGRLIHGNELIPRISTKPEERRKRSSMRKHSLPAVQAITERLPNMPMDWDPIPGITCANEVFCGYLLLDALIANQDRHYENWGYVLAQDTSIYLAPTFDHASSLGRNETEENMKDRLETKDKGRSIERYVEKARSAMYASQAAKQPLLTLDAFLSWGENTPAAALAWLRALSSIHDDEFRDIMETVPSELITDTAIEFTTKMLTLNKQRLLETMGRFS